MSGRRACGCAPRRRLTRGCNSSRSVSRQYKFTESLLTPAAPLHPSKKKQFAKHTLTLKTHPNTPPLHNTSPDRAALRSSAASRSQPTHTSTAQLSNTTERHHPTGHYRLQVVGVARFHHSQNGTPPAKTATRSNEPQQHNHTRTARHRDTTEHHEQSASLSGVGSRAGGRADHRDPSAGRVGVRRAPPAGVGGSLSACVGFAVRRGVHFGGRGAIAGGSGRRRRRWPLS